VKVVILAGGFGTRISEESHLRPKPMVEIGGKPLLWHIMNIYSAHGLSEFIIAAGYKAEYIKQYFLNFYALNNDLSVDLATGSIDIHSGKQPAWKVHIVDTGLYTKTGGRLKRLKQWLEDSNTFMLTYGDGLADIDIKALLKFHESHDKLATVTTVLPPGRFGRVALEGSKVTHFNEKMDGDEGWINGGYFVLNTSVLDYIEGDSTVWERSPLEKLSNDGHLMGYRHNGFWSCMDTLKEKNMLEDLWNSGKAPWTAYWKNSV